jgi:hypothetical protein
MGPLTERSETHNHSMFWAESLMSTHWPRFLVPAILIVLVVVGCGGQPGSASSQRSNLITFTQKL